jgi:hemerythrin-like domain-containing protein
MKSAIEFRSPDAGEESPVGMWVAYHERGKRSARLLTHLKEHIARQECDEEAQQSAAAIRRHFNEAAPRHHEDEEVDLFPLLRERGPGETEALAALDRVEDEHVTMADLWRRLDGSLARISAGEGAGGTLDRALVACFAAMYDRHIEIEEHIVLPALRRALDLSDWQSVGRAMAERRGLDWR